MPLQGIAMVVIAAASGNTNLQSRPMRGSTLANRDCPGIPYLGSGCNSFEDILGYIVCLLK